MKYARLHPFYKEWFFAPFHWIFLCFFQIDHFATLAQPQDYFWQLSFAERKERLLLTLKVLLPILICATITALLWTLVLFVFTLLLRAPLPLDELPLLLPRLLLSVLLIAFSGSLLFGLPRGITLGIIWSFVLPLRPAFTPTEAILSFGCFGAFIFGTVFLCEDSKGDMASSIFWVCLVILLWLAECLIGWTIWSGLELLSSIKMLLLFVGMSIAVRPLTKKVSDESARWSLFDAPSLGKAKAVVPALWLLLWSPLAFSISLVSVLRLFLAGSSTAAMLYILSQIPRGLVLTAIFFSAYILGIARVLVHPVTMASVIFASIKSRREPEKTQEYLDQSALRWNHAIFLSLPLLHPMISSLLTDRESVVQICKLMRHARQMRALKKPLQRFLLDYLPQQTDCRKIATVASFFAECLPTSQEEQAESAQLRSIQIRGEQLPLLDFGTISSFAPFYDASQQVAAALREGWNAYRQVTTLEKAKEFLQEIPASSRWFSPVRSQQLQQNAAQWRTIIDAEIRQAQSRIGQQGPLVDPYHPGKYLSEIENTLFVGREDLAAELEYTLRLHAREAPLFVYGSKRMGKTSLLEHLPSLLSAHFIPIRYDLQSASLSSNETQFLCTLAAQIQQRLQSRNLFVRSANQLYSTIQACKNAAEKYELFWDWIVQVQNSLKRKDLMLVLTFDEFESLNERKEFDFSLLKKFFQRLIKTCPQVALLFCSPHAQEDLGSVWEEFFISAKAFKVTYLFPQEARSLISKANEMRPNQPPLFSEQIIAAILGYTAFHPYLIQVFCSSLIQILINKRRSQASSADVSEALERSFQSIEAHFPSIWDASTPLERRCLLLLQEAERSSLQDGIAKTGLKKYLLRQALHLLTDKDLVTREGQIYSITVPMFKIWIERNAQTLSLTNPFSTNAFSVVRKEPEP